MGKKYLALLLAAALSLTQIAGTGQIVHAANTEDSGNDGGQSEESLQESGGEESARWLVPVEDGQ